MKKYFIDVIYTSVYRAEVEAEDETTAITEAYYLAGEALPDQLECTGINAEITHIQ